MVDIEAITDSLKGLGEGLGRALNTLFGSQNSRLVKKMQPVVDEINRLEEWAEKMDGDAVRDQTKKWKEQISSGELTLDEILPKAFALVRVAAQRTLGMRHYDVQLIGGMAMNRGSIAEMATGEGKTLVATLAAYLNALSQKVFVVTVNDYLALRDSQWMAPVYEYMGLTVGAIQSHMSPQERHPVYAGDIIYATNNELGFDYLRDNMKQRVEDQVQRKLGFAIIDEVDSILIDEARTPLIISGPATGNSEKYRTGMQAAKRLKKDEHFETKEKEKSATLTEAGIVAAQKLMKIEDFYTNPEHMEWPHIIEQCLRAIHIYAPEVDYVVKDGQVIIVDEFTGRLMEGRRWGDGLHQAVEAKEGLRPRAENQTLATITFQNYFRLFNKLSGMTGTAMTEAGEFAKIYDLDVVSIPTNKPISRLDDADVVYLESKDKWVAIANEIEAAQKLGQPVLVGTTSIENSELLSGVLSRRGVKHEVLNAKQHEREASIVAQAGRKGHVTVATNMAGRGTDIVLGGNGEAMLLAEARYKGFEVGSEEYLSLEAQISKDLKGEKEEVLNAGGLYVIGTERHESRRIDNQLRGRSGRQGDPGRSRFFLSLDDPLMRRFYRDWVKNFLSRAGMGSGEPVESKMVSNAIKKAQKKVEDYHFEIRKSLLEYDEVMNEQRKMIYSQRQSALEGESLRDRVMAMAEEVFDQGVNSLLGDGKDVEPDWPAVHSFVQRRWPSEISEGELANIGVNKISDTLYDDFSAHYSSRVSSLGEEEMHMLERFLVLNTIDQKWKEHLYTMDALRAGIGLRGYAQVDPKNEYKKEGLSRFQDMLFSIADDVVGFILRVQIQGEFESSSSVYEGQQASHPNFAPAQASPSSPGQPPSRKGMAVGYDKQPSLVSPANQSSKPKIARNAPCPCGSKKKYKQCCGKV
jgi:preprotein translocase subunit SecA